MLRDNAAEAARLNMLLSQKAGKVMAAHSYLSGLIRLTDSAIEFLVYTQFALIRRNHLPLEDSAVLALLLPGAGLWDA